MLLLSFHPWVVLPWLCFTFCLDVFLSSFLERIECSTTWSWHIVLGESKLHPQHAGDEEQKKDSPAKNSVTCFSFNFSGNSAKKKKTWTKTTENFEQKKRVMFASDLLINCCFFSTKKKRKNIFQKTFLSFFSFLSIAFVSFELCFLCFCSNKRASYYCFCSIISTKSSEIKKKQTRTKKVTICKKKRLFKSQHLVITN